MKKLIAIISLFGILQSVCSHKCEDDTRNNNCDVVFRDDTVERDFERDANRCVRDRICRQ